MAGIWQNWQEWRRRGRGWQMTAVLCGLLCMSVGCNPGALAFILMPFGDNTTHPDCKLASKDKEVTVAILSTFGEQMETRLEVASADRQLAELLKQQLSNRCAANKEKMKFVPPEMVSSYVNNRADRRALSTTDIGKHFKADYVVSLEIASIRLLGSGSSIYQASAEIDVKVYDVHSPAGEAVKFSKTYEVQYPREGRMIDTSSMTLPQFRVRFLNKIANDMAHYFTGFPREIGMEMDMD